MPTCDGLSQPLVAARPGQNTLMILLDLLPSSVALSKFFYSPSAFSLCSPYRPVYHLVLAVRPASAREASAHRLLLEPYCTKPIEHTHCLTIPANRTVQLRLMCYWDVVT